MTGIPQHLSVLTLGAADLAALREFYRSWGWAEVDASSDAWCAFDLGGCLLSIYPVDLLGEEAAPGEFAPTTRWRGFTLAINLATEDRLLEVFDAAVSAGALRIQNPTRREWGGMSGYVADPEGNRWEFATGGPNPAPTAV